MIRLTTHLASLLFLLALAGQFAFGISRCCAETEDHSARQPSTYWRPVGLSGGGGMFSAAISPADSDLMMLNCDMSAACISEDGGRNWRMIHHEELRSDTRCRPGFHPIDADIIYASSGGRLRISRDRGRTFSPIGDLKEPLYGEIAIHSAEPDLMLVGTRNGRCWRSADGGNRWTGCPGPTGQLLGFHFDQTGGVNVAVAATDRGIWRTDDGGATWKEKTKGLPWTEIQGFAAGSNARTGGMCISWIRVLNTTT